MDSKDRHFWINVAIKERQLLLCKIQMEKYLEAIQIYNLMEANSGRMMENKIAFFLLSKAIKLLNVNV